VFSLQRFQFAVYPVSLEMFQLHFEFSLYFVSFLVILILRKLAKSGFVEDFSLACFWCCYSTQPFFISYLVLSVFPFGFGDFYVFSSVLRIHFVFSVLLYFIVNSVLFLF